MSADEQPQGLNGMDLIVDGEPIYWWQLDGCNSPMHSLVHLHLHSWLELVSCGQWHVLHSACSRAASISTRRIFVLPESR